MNRERPALYYLCIWSGIVAILIDGVDGFALTSRIPTKHEGLKNLINPRRNRIDRIMNRQYRTELESATQAYLDSLSGFGRNGAVPSLQSFAPPAFMDDWSNTASFLLADNNLLDVATDVTDLPVSSLAANGGPISTVADYVTSGAASAAVESIDSSTSSVQEDLWGLGSTVFERVSSEPTATVGGRSAQDTLANYWDTVVMKTIPSWYESTKAKQEEFVASILAQQQKERAVSTLLPKNNPLEGLGDSLQNVGNPFKIIGESFQGLTLPTTPEIPSLSKIADASLLDIFSALGRTLATIARGFWYMLAAVVEFLTGGNSSLGEITSQIKFNIDQSMNQALETIRSSLYELGQVTLQEAATFLVQVVFRFVELLFQLVSSVCQAFTGRGLDVWLQTIGHGLSEQAVLATNALSSSVHDLSNASLAELAAILVSYGVAVARVLVESPRFVADAFSTSGATELLQNTLSSTTSLLGSVSFPY